MTGPDELVTIGRITGTHGIKGMVKVHLHSGDDATLRAVDRLLLQRTDGRRETVVIAGMQAHGRKTLLSLEGYGTINDVLPLVGGDILVRRDQLPEPEADEYYWTDLIGLRVVTESGDELGMIREIIATGSNDVYVVKGGEKEYLLPATEEVVKDVDLGAGLMTVAPLDGMLDL